LAQLNLLTRFTLCEEFQQTVEQWQWRHRSFLEYFAGRWLVKLLFSPEKTESDEARDWLRRIHEEVGQGRELRQDADWLLRYALGYASAKAEGGARTERDRLALVLIEWGNPWVVYHSLQDDQLKFSDEVTGLVRWLVHRDDNLKRDYRNAWQGKPGDKRGGRPSWPVPGIDARKLWESPTRDSACLIPFAEIECGFDADESDPANWLSRLSRKFRREEEVLNNSILKKFQSRFVEIPEQKFNARQFHGGVNFAGLGVKEPKAIPIGTGRRLEMADFLVTNELWELFEPGHRRWRTDRNADEKSPVVNVNWYMAQAFCAWLTAQDEEWEYGLPTEWEWEAAVRWPKKAGGHHVKTKYWWGDKPQCRAAGRKPVWLMNCLETRIEKTTTRDQALERHREAGLWHPSRQGGAGEDRGGLLDLHGNVWEWCTGEYEPGGSPLRVLRGGPWVRSGFLAEASDRDHDHASGRGRGIGVRVVRRGRVSPAVLEEDL